jgi:hypothetical protein
MSNSCLTNFAISHQTTGKALTQDVHLVNVIKKYSPSTICNFTDFDRWRCYHQGAEPWDLILFSHTEWRKISDICKQINSLYQQLSGHGLIFLAINKYLLLPEMFNDMPDNYNQSIIKVVDTLVDKFTILDSQYQTNDQGNLGNFLSPDNRVLLCKKS